MQPYTKKSTVKKQIFFLPNEHIPKGIRAKVEGGQRGGGHRGGRRRRRKNKKAAIPRPIKPKKNGFYYHFSYCCPSCIDFTLPTDPFFFKPNPLNLLNPDIPLFAFL